MSGPVAVAEGTRLHLLPTQWRPTPSRHAHAAVDIAVVKIHQSSDGEYAWVYGHAAEGNCECPGPWCQELLVRVDALLEAVVPQ